MTRYYCHRCRQQCNVTNDGGDVRCTNCDDTFVEEIQSREGSPTSGGTTTPPFAGGIPVNENPFGMFPGSPFSRLFSHITGIVGGAGNSGSSGVPTSPHNRSFQDFGGPSSRHMSNDTTSQTSRPRAQPTQNQRIGTDDEDPMALFLQSIFAGNRNQRGNPGTPNTTTPLTQGSTPAQFSFIQIIRGPDHEGGGTTIFGTNPNPNLQDYAWGPNGLDNVLTALLNQFEEAQEHTRALRPEDIKRLPIIKVTQEHVDKGTQCTTCMETFVLGEEVAQLNCKHIFHKACIEPWLQRKNTCPICRTTIDPNDWGPCIADIDELD